MGTWCSANVGSVSIQATFFPEKIVQFVGEYGRYELIFLPHSNPILKMAFATNNSQLNSPFVTSNRVLSFTNAELILETDRGPLLLKRSSKQKNISEHLNINDNKLDEYVANLLALTSEIGS